MNLLQKTEAALRELFAESAPAAAAAGEEEQAATIQASGVLVTDPSVHGSHLHVLCRPDQVVPAAQLMDREGFFLEAISGVDWFDRQQIEVLYDYNRLGGEHCRVMVRTFLPRTDAAVPTITSVFPAADWHERETFDFYGVRFEGHPHLIRILLPEDADFHPLLKDYSP